MADTVIQRRTLLPKFCLGLLLCLVAWAATAAWLGWPPFADPGHRANRNADRAAGSSDTEPADVSQHYLQQGLQQRQQNPRQAIQSFLQVPVDSTLRPEALRHAAYLSLLTDDQATAETALLELATHQLQDAAVQLSLAELYFRTGRFRDAVASAEAATQLNPGRAETYLLQAEALDELQRVPEMVEPLQQALELAPDSYAVRANLAYALHYVGELQSARQVAEWCLQRSPDDAAVRRILAAILRDLGDYAAALEQVRQALQQIPNDLQGRLLEADLLLFENQAEAAWSTLIELYPVHRSDRRYLSGLARAALLSGRRQEALQYQQELARLLPPRDQPANVLP